MERQPAPSDAWLAEPAALEAWLETARPGDSFEYARALWLPKCAVAELVRSLRDEGEIATVQRREGDRFVYLAQRRAEPDRARPVPGEDARVRALGGDAARLLIVLKWLAAKAHECPSNAQLASLADLRDRHQAAYQLQILRDARLIEIETVPVTSAAADARVITIIASDQRTAWPSRARAATR